MNKKNQNLIQNDNINQLNPKLNKIQYNENLNIVSSKKVVNDITPNTKVVNIGAHLQQEIPQENKKVVLKREGKQKLSSIMDNLGISDEFTKAPKKPITFSTVKDNIPLVKNYNFMADLLMLPETTEGYKYLLVVDDLANNAFDIEPMKDKEATTTRDALKTMIDKRNFIGKPQASIRTDGGGEFAGDFQKYCYQQGILHKVSVAGRHTQTGNVEALNRQLAHLFMNYLNKKEEELGESYHNWTDILDEVRKQLNQYRKLKLPDDIYKYNYPLVNLDKPPKFKVGDIVYRLLDQPINALGHQEATANFRTGDYRYDKRTPHKILKILYYSGSFPYRYIISGVPNASYNEDQLKKASPEEKEEKYVIKEILGHRRTKGVMYYQIWWKGYPKKEATMEPRENLLNDIPKQLEEYDKLHKVKLINGN